MKFKYFVEEDNSQIFIEIAHANPTMLASITTLLSGYNVAKVVYFSELDIFYLEIIVDNVSFDEAREIYETLKTSDFSHTKIEIKKLWGEGEGKLRCVKKYKELTGEGLKESKAVCDVWFAEWELQKERG